MDWKHATQGAKTADKNRRRMRREGMTMRGDKLWSDDEKSIVKTHYPNYDVIHSMLPHRTRVAVVGAAARLNVRKSCPCWKASDIAKLRKTYPSATSDEICRQFPDRTWEGIKQKAQQHGLRRDKKNYVSTGFAVIDQIRAKCFEIRWTMRDLDAAAGTKNYFYCRGWRHAKKINYAKVGRAISALDGIVTIHWPEY